MKHILKKSLLALALLATAPTLAAGEASFKPEAQVPMPPMVAEKDWHFTIGLYSWVTAVDGKAGFHGLTGSAHSSMKQTLKRLDLSYMGYLEVGYKRWSIATDLLYAKFSADSHYRYGPLSGDIDFKLRQMFLTGRLQYRVVDTEAYTLDLFAGVRWNSIRSEVDVETNVNFKQPLLRPLNGSWKRRLTSSKSWVDPIIGARNIINLNRDWFLLVSGDIGGFNVGSSLTWQAMGGAGYRFNSHVSCMAAYRAMSINFDKNDFKLDTLSHGPLVSVVVSF